MENKRQYVLITPCRDEREFAHRTLESVARQSEPPKLWVIVDDGSSDGTDQIVQEYADRLSFIRLIRRPNRGRRSVGPGVIETFYYGLESVDLSQFDYLCKLDLDLDLPPTYFAELMDWMERDPRLGTCSGKPYFPSPANVEKSWAGAITPEVCGDEMSVGMTKFYRVECFRQIGGFVREVMWDGIDCHRCRMLGWKAQSEDIASLRFLHLRPMGSSHKGIWTGRMRHGFGQYFMGTGLLYMAVSSAFRMTRPPLVAGGLAMLWGYLKAMLDRQQRYADEEFRRFLNRYQRNCLVKGKRRATAELEESMSAPPAAGAIHDN